MFVEIPEEFRTFVATLISDGRFKSETEVVAEALRLLRDEILIRDIDEGTSQLERGEY